MQTVHVRVSDADSARPTPVRIRFTDATGNYYAPFGRLVKFPTGSTQDVGGNLMLGVRPYAYIDGACEISLPVGAIDVEIHKGPEYAPARSQLELGPGKPRCARSSVTSIAVSNAGIREMRPLAVGVTLASPR